jgi:hypothetical protein
MMEVIVLEEGYVFNGNLVLYKIYPSTSYQTVISIPEGWGIYHGTKEELIEQGFTFDENYFE